MRVGTYAGACVLAFAVTVTFAGVDAYAASKDKKAQGAVTKPGAQKWQPGVNCRTGRGAAGPQGILPKCPKGTY